MSVSGAPVALTPAEREVALMLLKGYGHKQIAALKLQAMGVEIDTLTAEHGALHSDTPVSSLRDHPAVRFVQQLIAHPAFGEQDLMFLRDPG